MTLCVIPVKVITLSGIHAICFYRSPIIWVDQMVEDDVVFIKVSQYSSKLED